MIIQCTPDNGPHLSQVKVVHLSSCLIYQTCICNIIHVKGTFQVKLLGMFIYPVVHVLASEYKLKRIHTCALTQNTTINLKTSVLRQLAT